MVKPHTAVCRRRKNAAAKQGISFGIRPAWKNFRRIKRSRSEARIRIVSWHSERECFSEGKGCGQAFRALASLLRRDGFVVGTVWIALTKFSRDAVFQHVGEDTELAMALPIVREVEQVTGALRESLQSVSCYSRNECIDIRDASFGGECSVLLR